MILMAYRNPFRNKLTYRQRCLKKLDSLLYILFSLTLFRRPVTFNWLLLLHSGLDTYNYFRTSRYLVPLRRVRILDVRYREEVLSGNDKGYFYDAFKMTKPQFDFIVNLIQEHPVFETRWKKPQALVDVQLKVALHRLTHNGTLTSFSAIGRQLGVPVGSVVRYTRRVANALCAHITRYIKWPTPEEKVVVKQSLGKGNFRDVVGVVDGTMIEIYRAPEFGRDTFATRKSNFAMGATGVCDHRGVFIFFTTGYTGSRHDSAAYKDTPLYQRKEDYFQGDEHLIGDAAYALTPTVITAYKGKNQPAHRDDFNKKLRSSRVKIEHAFGWLKSFCCINQQIMACVVLYNLLETEDIPDADDQVEERVEENDGFFIFEDGDGEEGGEDAVDTVDMNDEGAIVVGGNIEDEEGNDNGWEEEEEEEEEEEVEVVGTGMEGEVIIAGGRVLVDTPWRPFETAAEERRYERVQRQLGIIKRERLREVMQQL
jgi:hypothetical protein